MKKKLKLSEDATIAGVCGGLAEYFGNDPLLVRIAFLFLFMVAPLPIVFVYMVLALCMEN